MGLQFAGCARRQRPFQRGVSKTCSAVPPRTSRAKSRCTWIRVLIADLAPKLEQGSVCVVGTNGKTTVTNLLADALELAGQRVVCNRTGANLDSGVATSLLHAGPSDWGVFECDELWLAKILPQLQATYVVLLNLFRDQLDRVGEIDRIQDSIVGALEKSPDTVLVYNADDPLCVRHRRARGEPLHRVRRGRGPGAAAEFGGRRADVPALLVHVGIRLSPVRATGIVLVSHLRVRACPPWTSRQRA